MKYEFEFELNREVKYPFKGEHKDAKVLLLTAPLNRHNKVKIPIQQELKKALNTIRKENANRVPAESVSAGVEPASDEQEKEISTSPEEVSMILMVGGADLEVMHKGLRALVLDGCCKIENECQMLESVYDNLDARDVDRLLYEFVANFIPPS